MLCKPNNRYIFYQYFVQYKVLLNLSKITVTWRDSSKLYLNITANICALKLKERFFLYFHENNAMYRFYWAIAKLSLHIYMFLSIFSFWIIPFLSIISVVLCKCSSLWAIAARGNIQMKKAKRSRMWDKNTCQKLCNNHWTVNHHNWLI